MKKALLSSTLILGMIISTFGQSVWDGSSTIWTNGSGTASDPYLIESAANLAYLTTSVNSGTTYSGKYFQQTVDIDLDTSDGHQLVQTHTRFRAYTMVTIIKFTICLF